MVSEAILAMVWAEWWHTVAGNSSNGDTSRSRYSETMKREACMYHQLISVGCPESLAKDKLCEG